MSRLVYVDTSAWLALLRPRDAGHDRVSRHFRALRRRRARFLSSEAVISETATRLRYDAGAAAVEAFRALLEAAAEDGSLTIRESSPELRARAFDLLGRYRDLRLSYADCVGAAIAQAEQADAVFALDEDFRVLGLSVEP